MPAKGGSAATSQPKSPPTAEVSILQLTAKAKPPELPARATSSKAKVEPLSDPDNLVDAAEIVEDSKPAPASSSKKHRRDEKSPSRRQRRSRSRRDGKNKRRSKSRSRHRGGEKGGSRSPKAEGVREKKTRSSRVRSTHTSEAAPIPTAPRSLSAPRKRLGRPSAVFFTLQVVPRDEQRDR